MAQTKVPDTERMDATATRSWLARWNEVERVTIAEARALTPLEKLEHLELLMASAHLFDWSSAEHEDERARALWMRLHGLQRW